MTVDPYSGATKQLVPEGPGQGVPTWSADGHQLIFGDVLYEKDKSKMKLHVFDDRTNRVSDLPGSDGLWSPRWSPNGEYIAAIRTDDTGLMLTRTGSGQWKKLMEGRSLDDMMWSADSKYIFLRADVRTGGYLLWRVYIPQGRIEEVADVRDFEYSAEHWFGVAPDGSVLGLRGRHTQEIYALTFKLP
jgi:Tol biopolymer transport system component